VTVAHGQLVGRVLAEPAGPTLVVVGGMHGNEPAGVEVGERLLGRLEHGALLAGEVIVLAGNPAALHFGRRYLGRDLNRQFTAERLAEARRMGTEGDVEQQASVLLADELAAIRARARGEVVVLDLHTTSAPGVPFSIVGVAPAAARLALATGLPALYGLVGTLGGTFGGHAEALGCTVIAVEGGQHASPEARTHLEAVVELALGLTGQVVDAGRAEAARALAAAARADLPTRVEVVLRHEVDPVRGFRMEPGFANIQRVAAGTLLAHDGDRPVHAPFDGLLLLPLYQPSGHDGFFFGREL
jgi:succinylglutamate desuccinylase